MIPQLIRIQLIKQSQQLIRVFLKDKMYTNKAAHIWDLVNKTKQKNL